MLIRPGLVLALAVGPWGLSAAPAPAGPKVPPQLAKARRDAARKAYEMHWVRLRTDTSADPEKLYTWSRRWMEAEQALREEKATERAAVQAHLDRMKQLEEFFARLA